MKFRKGFVSNSSSSSFILCTSDDLKIAKKHKMKAYKVTDLIKIFEEMRDLVVASDKISRTNGPYFIFEDLYFACSEGYYKQLIELEKKYPGCHITEAFDRDRAYGLDFDFRTFETDL